MKKMRVPIWRADTCLIIYSNSNTPLSSLVWENVLLRSFFSFFFFFPFYFLPTPALTYLLTTYVRTQYVRPYGFTVSVRPAPYHLLTQMRILFSVWESLSGGGDRVCPRSQWTQGGFGCKVKISPQSAQSASASLRLPRVNRGAILFSVFLKFIFSILLLYK